MKKKGFTLIELIIYIAIVGMLSVALLQIGTTLSSNTQYQAADIDISTAAETIMTQTTKRLRNAKEINTTSSIFEQVYGALEFSTYNNAESPVRIWLNSSTGSVLMLDAQHAASPLHSDDVFVDTLRFVLIDNDPSYPSIQMTLGLHALENTTTGVFYATTTMTLR